MATSPPTETFAEIAEADASALVRVPSNLQIAEADASALIKYATTFTGLQIAEVDLSVLCYAAPCLTRRAQVIFVRRSDGVVKGFTTFDRDLVYLGITCSACASFLPSASESSAEIGGVSNMQMTGVISLDGISEFDLEAGLYDGAFFEVWEVPWDSTVVDPQAPFRVLAGWTGNVSQGQSNYKAEVLGPGARLNQLPLINVLSPVCRWKFADPLTCGVDGLSDEALKLAGQVVTKASGRGQFYATGMSTPSPTSPHTWFAQGGTVRWLTGRNAGALCEVAQVNFVNESGPVESVVLPTDGLVTLWQQAPFIPARGDTFDLLPGCPHNAGACKGYANFVNFGGFDRVPGTDATSQVVTGA